jgi:hypothetical protein
MALNVARWRGMAPWPRGWAQIVTLGFVALAWLPFRAESLDQAGALLARLGSGLAGWVNPGGLPLAALLLFGVVFFRLSDRAPSLENWAVQRLRRLRPLAAVALLSATMSLVIALGPEGVPGFLYYRF